MTIKSNSPNATTYSQSTSAGASETISLSINQNAPQTIAVGGTKTTGDTITVTVYDAALSGGLKAVTYTVTAADTLATIATGVAAALTADTSLQGIGVSAAAVGAIVTLSSNSLNATTLRQSTSSTATETIAINVPVNGTQTAVIGGTKTTGNTLTVTVYDAGLSGGSKSITYTVLAADTLTTVATALASSITADTSLSAIGVSATSSGPVVNILSTSASLTTYAKSTSGGATETITLAPASSATVYGYNNLNELTSIAAGGPTAFQGSANKALTSASVNSLASNLAWSEKFSGSANLTSGAITVPVSATDGAANVKTNSYQINLNGPASKTPSFDANGNMTSDGTNSYAWDAENRLIQVTYPGTGNSSQFSYDPVSGLVKIVEVAGGAISSTKQFVRCESLPCEERDASSLVTKRFFAWGQTISAANYFYTKDHLGSVRDLVDASGNVQAHYEYDMWGNKTSANQAVNSDFQYANYYFHLPSNLNMAIYRNYISKSGQWLNRDFLQKLDGVSLYAYCLNNPILLIDPLGLDGIGPIILDYARAQAGSGFSPGAKQCNVLVNRALLGAGAIRTSLGNVGGIASGLGKADNFECCFDKGLGDQFNHFHGQPGDIPIWNNSNVIHVGVLNGSGGIVYAGSSMGYREGSMSDFVNDRQYGPPDRIYRCCGKAK